MKNKNNFVWERQQRDYENWDSFTQLNLITLSEAKFDISLTLDEAIEQTLIRNISYLDGEIDDKIIWNKK